MPTRRHEPVVWPEGRAGRTERKPPNDDREVEIVTTCVSCGVAWEPHHHDFVVGTWRVCPSCRGSDASGTLPGQGDPLARVTAHVQVKDQNHG